MTVPETKLKARLSSNAPVIIAELTPPKTANPAPVRETLRVLKGKVDAIGVSDNRSGVCMSALAAASLVVEEGIEPILHMVTRDRNRIALLSDCLGAQALGIHNLLITTGGHQTLGPFRSAKNVFDLDSIQLIDAFSHLDQEGAVFGASETTKGGDLCIGAVASPDADPKELQLMRLAKKVKAGASFLITQPVFDAKRFEKWWGEVQKKGLAKKTAFIAGIEPVADMDTLDAVKNGRPNSRLPAALIEKLSSKPEAGALREEGIRIAVETIERLKSMGLSGFEIRVGQDPKVALEIIDRAKLRTN